MRQASSAALAIHRMQLSTASSAQALHLRESMPSRVTAACSKFERASMDDGRDRGDLSLRRGGQQFAQRLDVEAGVRGRKMATSLGRGWDQIEPGVLDALECIRGEAGFRRVTLVVG